ncbi:MULTISPECIES: LysR family transcriptional regulator [unclassified Variovorax]|uniref:LysR family transcriptional regulator n=1 Tax=unclassified Variovorax TaxID=663243 RepID=UPI003F48AE39
MDRFSTLQLYVRVFESSSFTKAAQEMRIGQPAVSKQISALEARLGARLFVRSPRGLHATAAGHDFYDSAVKLLAEFEEAESRIGRGHVAPAGLVRVAAPPALARMYLVPRLPAFFAQFPDIAVEVSVSERHVDLIKDGIDVALRIGNLSGSSLIARKIGSMHICTVASPSYIAQHGIPEDPAQLRFHNLVTGHANNSVLAWRFETPAGPLEIEPTGNIRSNDAEAIRAAVLAGLGIAHDSQAMFQSDLDAGTVVPILQTFRPTPRDIHAVTAGDRRVPHRLRVFIDLLTQMAAEEPGLRAR